MRRAPPRPRPARPRPPSVGAWPPPRTDAPRRGLRSAVRRHGRPRRPVPLRLLFIFLRSAPARRLRGRWLRLLRRSPRFFLLLPACLSLCGFTSPRPPVLAGREEDGARLRRQPPPPPLPGRLQRRQRGGPPGPGPALRHHQPPRLQSRRPGRPEVRRGAPLSGLPGAGLDLVTRDLPGSCHHRRPPPQPGAAIPPPPLPGGGSGGFPEAGRGDVAADLRGSHLQRHHPPHPRRAVGLHPPAPLREVQGADRSLRGHRPPPDQGPRGQDPGEAPGSGQEEAGIKPRGVVGKYRGTPPELFSPPKLYSPPLKLVAPPHLSQWRPSVLPPPPPPALDLASAMGLPGGGLHPKTPLLLPPGGGGFPPSQLVSLPPPPLLFFFNVD